MEGRQSANLILDQLVDNSDLVEIVLESDAYYTEPYMHLVDGVYGGAPRAGRLIKASLVSSSVH